ncbi:MAG: class I SAM-dependent RNA methyltransferase [Deltaproteobacteria bacterium]|nr:MAG: class I SAM-dependent RNA methyltransferase [Deltaproteobacteria bacterium]
MIDLTIDSLCFGGDGIGRYRQQAVFVPRTAPGDRVRCRIVNRRKNYLRAEVVELLESGGARRKPPCPWYGSCGGCSWQHLDDQSQAEWKARLLADQFRRGLRRDDLPEVEFIPAKKTWNYRSRVQFKCHHRRDGRLAIGFYRPGSHFVENVATCAIADDRINHMLALLRAWLPRFQQPDRIPQVDVIVGDAGPPHIVLHLFGGQPVPAFVTAVCGEKGYGLHVQRGRKDSLQSLTEACVPRIRPDSSGLELATVPGGFHQVHLEQNRRLVQCVLELAGLQGDERVVDLFCGMGNLTLPMAGGCRSIVGVEDYAPAIERARFNARSNSMDNAAFVAAPAAEYLDDLASGVDLLLLDPPRTGARDCMASVARLRPGRILYVSCDPATQVRDIAPLFGQGYRLERLVGIDMFPQTWHIESLALLVRREG